MQSGRRKRADSALLLLNLFVVIVMFSIGLRVSGGELLDILRKRALFVRTLLANCVLIPAIGFLLVRVFPLTPDVSGDAPVAASVHVDRLTDRRNRPRVMPGVGNRYQHAQRDCCAVRGALLLSGHQRLYDSDCLYIADGAHEPAFPSRVRRMAHTAASGGGVGESE